MKQKGTGCPERYTGGPWLSDDDWNKMIKRHYEDWRNKPPLIRRDIPAKLRVINDCCGGGSPGYKVRQYRILDVDGNRVVTKGLFIREFNNPVDAVGTSGDCWSGADFDTKAQFSDHIQSLMRGKMHQRFIATLRRGAEPDSLHPLEIEECGSTSDRCLPSIRFGTLTFSLSEPKVSIDHSLFNRSSGCRPCVMNY